MSCSFKAPVFLTRPNNTRAVKRQASKAIRRLPVDVELVDGNHYRRLFPQYDLCDDRRWYQPARISLDTPDAIVTANNKSYQVFMK